MALMEVHYSSFAMGSNISLNVFVPTPGSSEAITDINESPKYDYRRGLPVLYLLHGAFGDAFSWIRYSNIDRYAQDRGIVVVMASAENSFYQNLKGGRRYYDFFTEELPTFIQNVFPVSRDPARTYIAGFSMGGYGAWYLANRRPDLFSKAASMSGALNIASVISNPPEGVFPFESAFADVRDQDGSYRMEGSRYDLKTLIAENHQRGCLPRLYQAVGKKDILYEDNLAMRDWVRSQGIALTYEEGPGAHDWDFWDEYIRHILDWLLED